jgi:hypothetical protein
MGIIRHCFTTHDYGVEFLRKEDSLSELQAYLPVDRPCEPGQALRCQGIEAITSLIRAN